MNKRLRNTPLVTISSSEHDSKDVTYCSKIANLILDLVQPLMDSEKAFSFLKTNHI